MAEVKVCRWLDTGYPNNAALYGFAEGASVFNALPDGPPVLGFVGRRNGRSEWDAVFTATDKPARLGDDFRSIDSAVQAVARAA